MSTCHTTSPQKAASTATLTVALAGNPNSGKTTLFNALTGLRQKVGNYPGITVEKKTGRCQLPNGLYADVIDLPGTYSLISRSPDETVAMEVLRGLRLETPLPDVTVVVVDASNLQRNLYLVSQLIELGRPLVVALNMMDVAQRRGLHVSPESLQRQLGVPVIPIVGHKRQGIDSLKNAIAHATIAPMPDWPIPQEMKEELQLVGGALAILDSQDHLPRDIPGVGFQLPCCADNPAAGQTCPPGGCRADQIRLDRYKAIAERLLIGDRADDLLEISRRQPVASLLASAAQRMGRLGIDPMQADIEAHYRWIEHVSTSATAPSSERSLRPRTLSWSERIDSVFIHRIWGLLVFVLIMATLFAAIFWAVRPIMDAIQAGIHWLGAIVSARLPEGPLKALVDDGIFAGVGAVVVFVPQIALLFFFLAVLEDSGYLARAAFLMDRLLARVGLHGKSFIPLLSSFACAIPGIMATRTIESRKDRLATILVAPFMSCSARLPVYTLLIGTFFAGYGSLAQAGIMLSLYVLGIVTAALMAWLFKRSLLKGPTPAFILEMPTYKFPQSSQVARQVWINTSEFLRKAGTTIFCFSILLWAMTYYPRLSPSRLAQCPTENARAAARLNNSLAGRFGHVVEPAIRPLGYDWKMGVGLVGAFAAREVFVSTMGIIYSTGNDNGTADLSAAMRADRHPDGRPVWTPIVAVSLLIWFVLAMQCMSTLAIVRRETGSWGWPLFMLLYMNVLAYAICLSVYQLAAHFAG